MELLTSYLNAVRRYLPRRHRDDIIAELSEELRLQMEARQAELGRELRDTEQMAILKVHGDPMTLWRAGTLHRHPCGSHDPVRRARHPALSPHRLIEEFQRSQRRTA